MGMKIIVGLGNPGDKYKNTRHNAGYKFVESLVEHKNIAPVDGKISFKKEEKFNSLIAETNFEGEKIVFVKPETYMNLSGIAVRKILDFYKADVSDLIIISDDVDLPLGTARVRKDGSSGGQKGLQNIIEFLKNDSFLRIRIGIKAIGGDADQTVDIPEKIDTANFVLGKFSEREKKLIDAIIEMAIEYILPHIGSKHEIPSHTLDVKIDSL